MYFVSWLLRKFWGKSLPKSYTVGGHGHSLKTRRILQLPTHSINLSTYYCKCKFPMKPHSCLLVGWSWSFCNFLKMLGSYTSIAQIGELEPLRINRIRIQTTLSWKFSIYFVMIFNKKKICLFRFLTVLVIIFKCSSNK